MSHLTQLIPTKVGSAVRTHGSVLRALHTSEWNISFECADHVWLTLELSDAFGVTGGVSGRCVARTGAVGAISINPPDQPVDLAIAGDYRAIQFAIPVRLTAAVAAEDHGLDASCIRFYARQGHADGQLFRLLCSFAAQWDGNNEDEPLRAIATLLLLRHAEGVPRPLSLSRAGLTPARLRRVTDFVEANLGKATVGGMAAEAGLSPFHFAREFRRTTGQSPYEFVITRRIARAMGLLGSTRLAIEDVARRSGFADASHLAHRMTKRLGCSPSEARTRLLL